MGISLERHRLHVATFEAHFKNYQKNWPRFLFRHEPIENAIDILKAGHLLSRAAAEGQDLVRNDIAPEAIIQRTHAAHSRARLYFRPRTPTQYHIEGIRKPTEYYQGKHAGFLVMLIFDSEKILTMEGTRFSCGNMQSSLSSVFDGDDGFNQLDFSGIYHDVANPTPDEKRKRCAEVLPESPLALDDVLKYIVVRTDADVASMKYLLHREELHRFSPMVYKAHGPGVFFDKYAALNYVDSAPGRINFQLRRSYAGDDIETKLELYKLENHLGRVIVSARLRSWTRYYVDHGASSGRYLLKVQLEDCFAHESIIELSNN